MKDYAAMARRRAEQMNQSAWFKLAQGPNVMRVLDTPESDTTQGKWYEYLVHREVGPKRRMVRCGKDVLTESGSCWICDKLIPKLKRLGKKSRAVALAPQAQFLVQIAKVTEEGHFEGPFLWTPSKGMARKILQRVIGGKRNALDPVRGRNFTIHREGTGKFDTEYEGPDFEDDPSPVPSRLQKKLKPFSELKEVPVYKESYQKAAYQGRDIREDDEDEEERKVMKKAKAKARPEPEEDDDDELEDVLESDDEEEEDDEDEDDAPKKKSKKKSKSVVSKKSKKVVDDDEEEDDEDEEEEDEDESDEDEDGDESDEDEEEEDDEDEDEAPKKKSKSKSKVVKAAAKKKRVVEEDEDEEESDDDEEDEEEEDEEEDEPPVKKKKKKPVVEPPPPSKKKKPAAAAKKKRK